MAATNENVAARFASALVIPTDSYIRPTTGSNLYTVPVYHERRDEHTRQTKGVFTMLAQLDSYRTTVGYIVQNNHTNKREVWLARLRYSNTTSRHLSHTGAAVRERERDNNTTFSTFHINTDVSWPNRVDCNTTFSTFHINTDVSWPNRVDCNSVMIAAHKSLDDPLYMRLRSVNEAIAKADLPKIRETSRRMHLLDAAMRCETTLRTYTDDVPEGYAETLQAGSQKIIDELRSLRDFAHKLRQCSLDEIRFAVRGFAALNKF
jgi:hypothetical protein